MNCDACFGIAEFIQQNVLRDAKLSEILQAQRNSLLVVACWAESHVIAG